MSDVYSYEGDSYSSSAGGYEDAVSNAYAQAEEVYATGYADNSVDNVAYSGGNAYESLYGDEAAPETPQDDQSDVKVAKFIGKDWNEEFQRILENEKGHAKYKMLSELAADFVYAAQTYGQIIISESSLPEDAKTIKPVGLGGIAGGEKFVCQNILFKFALDSSGLYGSDEAAMKSASNELKGLMSYYNLQLEGICFPLMALIDFRGYRLVAISMLPIGKESIIYGSSDAGATVHADNEEFNSKMKRAAEILNLKGHNVGKVNGKLLYSCGDIEGHKGSDGRFYLLDFGRAFPPQVRMIKDQKRRHLYELLRPELVASYRVPLSSDALTAWGKNDDRSEEHNDEVRQATLNLYSTVIPEFAAFLDGLSDEAFSKIRLTEELHRHGINVRHLGFVRTAAKNDSVRRKVLFECVARAMKSDIQTLLRNKNRELMIPSDEPYRKVALQFLNSALARHPPFWEHIRIETQAKFVSCLTAEERESLPKFIISLNMYELFVRFSDLSGIRLSPQAMEELCADPSAALRLVDPDIEAILATVKYMNLIEHSAGVVLAHEATKCTGRASDRLFTMADSKFRRSLERTPNSSLTLFDWAKMLHTQAQRCADSLKPQEESAQETAAQLAERLSQQRSKAASVSLGKTNVDVKIITRAASANSRHHIRLGSGVLRRASSTRPADSPAIHVPLDPNVVQEKARACFSSAEEKLRRAIKIKTDYAEARLELAHLLYDYGMFLISVAVASSNEATKYELAELGAQKIHESLSIDPCRLASISQRAHDGARDFQEATDFASLRDSFVEAQPMMMCISGNRKDDGQSHYEVAMLCAKFCRSLIDRSTDPEIVDKYISVAAEKFKMAIEVETRFLTYIERFLQLDAKPADFLVFSQIANLVGPMHDLLKNRCEHVSSMNLPRCHGITEASIQSLLLACSNLRVLSLDGNTKSVTDSLMRFIALNCSSLEVLSVKDCKAITIGPVVDGNAVSGTIMAAVSSASFLSTGFGAIPGMTAFGLDAGVLSPQNIGSSLASSQSGKAKADSTASSEHTSKCSNTLQFLDISGCSLVESKSVVALSIFTRLENLLMAGVNKLVDADLIKLMESSKKIQTISISDCFQLTNAGLASVSKLEKLVSLSAANCKSFSDEGLIAALKSCTSLQVLDVSFNRGITDSSLKAVSSIKASSIKSLNFAGCESITDGAVKAVLKRAGSTLFTIDLSGCPLLSDATASHLATYCANVAEVSLANNVKLTAKALDSLGNGCSNLERLDISGCSNISSGLTSFMASCPLNQLKAASCSFTPEDVGMAFSAKDEKRRGGQALKYIDLSDIRIADEALSRITAASTQVRVLKLSQCGALTNISMSKIAQLQCLSELYLDSVYYLNDAGIEKLFDPLGHVGKTLRTLSLQKCSKLSDAAMLTIAEYGRGLKRLLLSKWRLQSSSVRVLLESCIDLEDLLIEACSELNIADTKAMIKTEFKRVSALIL